MPGTEPRVPSPRRPDEPTTYLQSATRARAERSAGRTGRHELRTAQWHSRALLRADQRRTRADRRAGQEVDRRLPDRTLGSPARTSSSPDTTSSRPSSPRRWLPGRASTAGCRSSRGPSRRSSR